MSFPVPSHSPDPLVSTATGTSTMIRTRTEDKDRKRKGETIRSSASKSLRRDMSNNQTSEHVHMVYNTHAESQYAKNAEENANNGSIIEERSRKKNRKESDEENEWDDRSRSSSEDERRTIGKSGTTRSDKLRKELKRLKIEWRNMYANANREERGRVSERKFIKRKKEEYLHKMNREKKSKADDSDSEIQRNYVAKSSSQVQPKVPDNIAELEIDVFF